MRVFIITLVVMEFQMQICSILFLLVDFGKVLCASTNELQQNSNASSRDQIPQILTEIHHVYIILTFVAFCLLSVFHKQ